LCTGQASEERKEGRKEVRKEGRSIISRREGGRDGSGKEEGKEGWTLEHRKGKEGEKKTSSIVRYRLEIDSSE